MCLCSSKTLSLKEAIGSSNDDESEEEEDFLVRAHKTEEQKVCAFKSYKPFSL